MITPCLLLTPPVPELKMLLASQVLYLKIIRTSNNAWLAEHIDLDHGYHLSNNLLIVLICRPVHVFLIFWGVGCKNNMTDIASKNPLDLIEKEHMFQSELCDTLERIADDLPDKVDCRLCDMVISALTNDLPIHHADEEEGLFPLLEQRAMPEDNLVEILARLSIEHATDESFANELMESLQTLAAGKKLEDATLVGYMLRGFFESYRRHLQWEHTIIIPLARKRLLDSDLKVLKNKMVEHRSSFTHP